MSLGDSVTSQSRSLLDSLSLKVEGICYANEKLEDLLFEELKVCSTQGGVGGFLPAVKQVGNVAALPGIVKV